MCVRISGLSYVLLVAEYSKFTCLCVFCFCSIKFSVGSSQLYVFLCGKPAQL